MRVAIMVACYNRKEITKRCLVGLIEQFQKHPDKKIDIYVYDDNSTDGTCEMIKETFPEIILVEGKGKTYWCKSMFALMKLALDVSYDFYLMINDDVNFYSNAIEIMFHSYYIAEEVCGIVGATKRAFSEKVAYGGRNQQGELLVPNGKIQESVWANWNCFLIDSSVVEQIGIIDGKYQHSWGDFDYSNRMIKAGIPIYETVQYIGECEQNSDKGSYKDPDVNRLVRLKKMFGPKGMPIYSYFRYNIFF